MSRKRQRSASAARDAELPGGDLPAPNGVEAVEPNVPVAQENADDTNHRVRGGNSNAPSLLTPSSRGDRDGNAKLKAVSPLEHPLTRRAVVWFRRDLRLHDNLALHAAARAQKQLQKAGGGEMALLPIYILHRPRRQRCGAVRFQFLLEAVEDLANAIANLHGRLLVLRGDAEDVLRVVLAAWGVTDLFFEAGVTPYAVARDDRVRAIARTLRVTVTTCRGVTLYDPHEIIRLNGGRAPTDYERLLEITEKMQQPAQPIPPPVELSSAAALSSNQLFALLKDFCQRDPNSTAHVIAGVDGDAKSTESELFVVPPLTALGLTPPNPHTPFIGGESEAMKRLDAFCKDERRVGLFEKPQTSPVAINAPSTTSLSAYLAFGCLSAREFFYRIMFIHLQFPLRPGPTQVTLEGQLMWREFFYCYACGTRNFDSQERNPGCKQIDWRLLAEDHVSRPEDDQQEPIAASDVDEKLAMRQLQCWKDGRTGFPWIDAVMRQINQEGWTHHAGRHAVACFLTRGVLYISWLRGAAYFQEKLVDMDWPINIGNWLWVSASCFFSNYRRVASPSTFPQRWDQQGHFIRKYIPALRHMPDKFVHEPWKAPLKVQRDAGCLIGKDYPFPIVDSKLATSRCIAGMSHAFSGSETGSSTSSGTSTRTPTDGTETGGSSPWSSDDMCYSYRGAASLSYP
ncbi:Cryptochrome-2 [Phytophthora pseudosyringae]|uniref:Cryptochrome-2 n=1 Tax=Phytophthora pseudosyringae TaxID=221518 RepID=A0A8T1WKS0_9STRA|nr:Cryptochrome-2 [Phytophthora pseudosyringae]